MDYEVEFCTPINRRRIGSVMITRKAVDAGYARELFCYMQATIINATAVYYNDSIEYTFYSDRLPETEVGQIIPGYNIDMTMSVANKIVDIQLSLI